MNRERGVAVAMCIGVLIGALIGALTHSIGLWTSLGIAFGLIAGLLLSTEIMNLINFYRETKKINTESSSSL